MGIMYAKGLGVSIDISMAKTLFAAAIKSGDADTKRTANDWNATINEPQSSSSSDHTTEYSDSLLGEEAFQSGKYTDALPLLQKITRREGPAVEKRPFILELCVLKVLVYRFLFQMLKHGSI